MTKSDPTLLVLNDQGGSVMDITTNVTATLRAQEHGHPPVICFEPGIVKRLGGNRYTSNISVTLWETMGDNQPAVVYPINLMVATRGGKDDMKTCFGIGNENAPQFTLSANHEHAVCFQQNQREEVRDIGDIAGALTAESGMHNTNYVIYPGNRITVQVGENNDHE